MTIQYPDNFASNPSLSRPLYVVLPSYSAAAPSAVMTRLGLTYLRNIGGQNPSDGAFVLNPTSHTNSIGRHFWNASTACCDLDLTAPDDNAYLKNMVLYFEAQGWPIDTNRVYLIGHSNGGFMVQEALCHDSDVFVAGSDLAGANDDAQGKDTPCTPAHAVAFRHVHGTADTEVGYSISTNISGMQSTITPVEGTGNTMDQWKTELGCSGSLTATGNTYSYDVTQAAGSTVEYAYSCPAGYALYLEKMNGSPHDPSYGGAHPMDSTFATDMVAWLLAHHR